MKGLKRVSIHSTAEDFERKRERDRVFGVENLEGSNSIRIEA